MLGMDQDCFGEELLSATFPPGAGCHAVNEAGVLVKTNTGL